MRLASVVYFIGIDSRENVQRRLAMRGHRTAIRATPAETLDGGATSPVAEAAVREPATVALGTAGYFARAWRGGAP
jgi:hypothetical protein